MSRIRVPFTPEQKAALAANPFTLSVNDYQIRFTVEFKTYLLAERAKNKTPWKAVFRKAGYDPDVLGKIRMDHIIQNIRSEAASPRGIHETARRKPRKQDTEKQQLRKAVHDLQEDVIRLQQQIEFLKKTQELLLLEDIEK